MSKYYLDPQFNLASYAFNFLNEDDAHIMKYFITNFPEELKKNIIEDMSKIKINSSIEEDVELKVDSICK